MVHSSQVTEERREGEKAARVPDLKASSPFKDGSSRLNSFLSPSTAGASTPQEGVAARSLSGDDSQMNVASVCASCVPTSSFSYVLTSEDLCWCVQADCEEVLLSEAVTHAREAGTPKGKLLWTEIRKVTRELRRQKRCFISLVVRLPGFSYEVLLSVCQSLVECIGVVEISSSLERMD